MSAEGLQPKLDPLAERKRITFEQAEGVEPLPQQLKLKELSPAFRAAAWNLVFTSIDKVTHFPPYTHLQVGDPWLSILKDRHVYRLHRPADEFSSAHKAICEELKPLIMAGRYAESWDFCNL